MNNIIVMALAILLPVSPVFSETTMAGADSSVSFHVTGAVATHKSIKVTVLEIEGQTRSKFQFCSIDRSGTESCRDLGSPNGYTTEELQERMSAESSNEILAYGGIAVAATGGLYFGALVVAIQVASAVEAFGLLTYAGHLAAPVVYAIFGSSVLATEATIFNSKSIIEWIGSKTAIASDYIDSAVSFVENFNPFVADAKYDALVAVQAKSTHAIEGIEEAALRLEQTLSKVRASSKGKRGDRSRRK